MLEKIITLFWKVWIVWISSTIHIIINGNKILQNYRFKMGTFSYDSLNLLARCIKLPKLTTDTIRLTVQAEEHWLGLAGLDLNIWIDRMNMY